MDPCEYTHTVINVLHLKGFSSVYPPEINASRFTRVRPRRGGNRDAGGSYSVCVALFLVREEDFVRRGSDFPCAGGNVRVARRRNATRRIRRRWFMKADDKQRADRRPLASIVSCCVVSSWMLNIKKRTHYYSWRAQSSFNLTSVMIGISGVVEVDLRG